MSADMEVLRGVDASRRAAWAKYYALRREVWRADGMAYVMRDWWFRPRNQIARELHYALQRAAGRCGEGDFDAYQAAWEEGVLHAKSAPYGYRGTGTAVPTGLGWPVDREGRWVA